MHPRDPFGSVPSKTRCRETRCRCTRDGKMAYVRIGKERGELPMRDSPLKSLRHAERSGAPRSVDLWLSSSETRGHVLQRFVQTGAHRRVS